MPNRPTPMLTTAAMAKNNNITSAKASAKPTYHKRGVGRVSAMALILSVSVA